MFSVTQFEKNIRGEHIYELDGNMLGFACLDFSEFMNRILDTRSSVEDYSILLNGVYPYYFSKSARCYVDAPYLVTNMLSKAKSKEQYYDDIVRMSCIAGVCYRLAIKLNNRGKLLYDNKKISKAFVFTSAALLNKFADSIVDALNGLYVTMGEDWLNDMKEHFLSIEKIMLESDKAYQVPYLDKFFVENKPLIIKTYYKPLSKYKKVAKFDVYKKDKEIIRVTEFLNSLYRTLGASVDTQQPSR